jgi:hypothetical protein
MSIDTTADSSNNPEQSDPATQYLRPRFPLGRVVATPGVLHHLAAREIDPAIYLHRHQAGDWGTVPPEDWQANDEALVHGGRLLSAYVVENVKIWVITEWDRSVTTLLLPSEY